jgi:hypothetical protein
MIAFESILLARATTTLEGFCGFLQVELNRLVYLIFDRM